MNKPRVVTRTEYHLYNEVFDLKVIAEFRGTGLILSQSGSSISLNAVQIAQLKTLLNEDDEPEIVDLEAERERRRTTEADQFNRKVDFLYRAYRNA